MVAPQPVVLRAGGDVDADLRVGNEVVVEVVELRQVDEQALALGAVDQPAPGVALAGDAAYLVAGDLAVRDVVEQEAVGFVVLGGVADHLEVIGRHQRIAGQVAAADVVPQQVVLGIHVVDAVAHLVHHVARDRVVRADVDVDAVARVGHVVALDGAAGVVPQVDAVAAVGHAQRAHAADHVVRDPHVGRAVEVDAEQALLDAVALERDVARLALDEDAGVHRGEIGAAMADGQSTHGDLRGADAHHVAFAAAIEDRAGFADERDRLVQPQVHHVHAGRHADGGARRRRGHDLLQRLARMHRRRRRPCQHQEREETKCMHGNGDPLVPPRTARRHDAAQASTSIRPLISMCIAWQKNVQ